MPAESRTPSPWLSIPAADYEAHMSSPQVRQLEFLSESFRTALERYRPVSVLVLGSATGNGFEHFPPAGVRRVIAIDVNPEYLEILRARYGDATPGLEIVCADIARCEIDPGSIDLALAGLILEYVDPASLVARVARWLAPRGVFSVVLQLPKPGATPITQTPFTSLELLEPVFRLVDPQDLDRMAHDAGLPRERWRRVELATGKSFYEADYRRLG